VLAAFLIRFLARLQTLGTVPAISRVSFSPSLEIQNLLNSGAPTDLNLRFGSAWQKPTILLAPRFFKLAAQIDF
jgi:hypothetical protein